MSNAASIVQRLREIPESLHVTRYCRETLHEAAALIEQQQAELAKVARTADGVIVVPGMDLFRPVSNGSIHWVAIASAGYKSDSPKSDPALLWSKCYSTKEAAEAARVGKE